MWYPYSPYPPPVPTFYSNCHIWHLVHALATPEPLDNVSHLCHVTSFFPLNPHHPPSPHPHSDHVLPSAPRHQTPQEYERHSKGMRGMGSNDKHALAVGSTHHSRCTFRRILALPHRILQHYLSVYAHIDRKSVV